jgi:hypothetical protein
MVVDSHVIYITSFILIIFALIIGFIGCIVMMKESFESVSGKGVSDVSGVSGEENINENWLSTTVPQDDTSFTCQKVSNNGTSLIQLDKVITKRFPIVIDYPWNWYQTQ